MNTKHVPICIAILVFATMAWSGNCMAKGPMVGGYSAASVTSEWVVAAADFAVKAEQKAMQDKKETKSAKLELVEIVSAEQQVVAGMNFRLTLKVKQNGTVKEADVVVYRKLDGECELTSWTWK